MRHGVELVRDLVGAGRSWIFGSIPLHLRSRIDALFPASAPANPAHYLNHSFEPRRQDAQLCYCE